MAVFSQSSHRRLFLYLARHAPHLISVPLLHFQSRPIAHGLGFITQNSFLASHTAFLESFRHLMPGKLLKYFLLPHLSSVGIKNFDFGRGLSPHKLELTPHTHVQWHIFYSPHPLVNLWWKSLLKFRSWLEARPFVYNLIRRLKFTLSV
jgi:CelD/BcsL family acetyltransferase involved in cellulose biosynthesis